MRSGAGTASAAPAPLPFDDAAPEGAGHRIVRVDSGGVPCLLAQGTGDVAPLSNDQASVRPTSTLPRVAFE